MTRDQIGLLLDDFSEDELLAAEMHLLSILHRRSHAKRDDASEAQFDKRREQFQASVGRRWRETLKSGAVSGMGGGGSISRDRLGRASGEIAYQYGDGDTLVLEKLRVYANQEVQSIEKFSLSEDQTELVYLREAASGGRTFSTQETYPYTSAPRA